eukprot:gene29675-5089_t
MAVGCRKKRGGRQSNLSAEKSSQELRNETIRLINDALENPRDLSRLRKLAAVRGLVNHQLRCKCWPLLLGVDPCTADVAWTHLGDEIAHRDSRVVAVDVERSLWSFTQGMSDEDRGVKREQLQRLLNINVVSHGANNVHYYQGLHDIASVLLMVLGEQAALPSLRHLSICHLRDCTRPDLDAVLELLSLLYPLLSSADPELADVMILSGLPPYFALSWFITWFAHDTPTLDEAARLFDLFLSSHPLMPLYLGAVAVRSHRSELLACDNEMPELHTRIVKMHLTRHLSVDTLVVQALQLYRDAPPYSLVRRAGCPMRLCVAPNAKLKLDHWVVPPHPTGRSMLSNNMTMNKLMGSFSLSMPQMGSSSFIRLLAQLNSGFGVVGKMIQRARGLRGWLSTTIYKSGLAASAPPQPPP